MSVMTWALPANRIAPAAGRTKVWMPSLTLSTAGILSATISTTNSTAIRPMAHQLLSKS